MALLALLTGACAPSSTGDERDNLVATFCTLYFEKADLMAALPWVAGAARAVLLDEMRRLPARFGTAPRPRRRSMVVQRQELPGTRTLLVRVEVRVSPPSGAAPDAGTWIRPFLLTVEDITGSGRPVWRITGLDPG